MNLVQLAPLWLVAILGSALMAAAAEDILRRRVSNLTVLVVLAAAGVAVALAGLSAALWENLLVFALVLTGGTLLFATGKVGGGDVKLLAAVGLWVDFERAVLLLAAVFLSGGVLALASLALRPIFQRTDGTALRARAKGVPYAMAIAAGALIVIVIQRQAGQRPSPLDLSQPAQLLPQE